MEIVEALRSGDDAISILGTLHRTLENHQSNAQNTSTLLRSLEDPTVLVPFGLSPDSTIQEVAELMTEFNELAAKSKEQLEHTIFYANNLLIGRTVTVSLLPSSPFNYMKVLHPATPIQTVTGRVSQLVYKNDAITKLYGAGFRVKHRPRISAQTVHVQPFNGEFPTVSIELIK